MGDRRDAGWYRILASLVAVTLPVFIILSSVLVLLYTARTWTRFEYRLPGFPEDRYGFTIEDRLRWSQVDINYLLGSEDISYYDAFVLEDGSPLHNERELRHMDDVRQLVNQVRWAWLAVTGILVFSLVALYRGEGVATILQSIMRGSVVAAGLIGVIILLLVASFSFLFVGFHRIFFEGETWIFPFSDTFIRLYPEQFWQHTFVLFIIIALILCGVLYFTARWRLRRSQ